MGPLAAKSTVSPPRPGGKELHAKGGQDHTPRQGDTAFVEAAEARRREASLGEAAGGDLRETLDQHRVVAQGNRELGRLQTGPPKGRIRRTLHVETQPASARKGCENRDPQYEETGVCSAIAREAK